jgi:hypothetical protein
MKLQVVLSEASFNVPAHYFIKLALTHDTQAEDSKSFQRTPVSSISSKTPQFAQTSFYFELPQNHPLNKRNAKATKSLLKLTACLINQETTPPSIAVSGTVGVAVFPNNALQRGILDMQIVYFHNDSKAEIGKCIVTLSVTKSEKGEPENNRLDPVDSFLNLHPPLIKAKTQNSERALVPSESFEEKSPPFLPDNALDSEITTSPLKPKSQEVAASPSVSALDKVQPILKINSRNLQFNDR